MDFLRIRQKAKERALARDREPDVVPVAQEPVPPASSAPAVAPAAGTIEDALRAELQAVVVSGHPAPGTRARVAAEEPALDELLDEFFWRRDETAPALPDLVAARALPDGRSPAESRREWLTFQLGGQEYAVEIEHVREIIKVPALTEVPRAPAHVAGVIMVRGEIVAVFDPRRRLGLPLADAGSRARVLVCDAGNGLRGLLVDAVSHVVRLAPSAIEPRPSSVGGIAADYIAGIGRDRSRLFVLLDAVPLLADAAPVAGGEARS